jgi:hypothetical protein
MQASPRSGTDGAAQAEVWSADPDGWADHAESRVRPLYEAVLPRLRLSGDTRLLDAECGERLARRAIDVDQVSLDNFARHTAGACLIPR